MLSGNDDIVRPIRRDLASVRLTRYDLLLWVIPAAFLLALIAAALLSAQIERALAAASVVGALALFEGLFRNPPTAGASR